MRYFKFKTALDQSMASDDVISDCGSESEESEASFKVDNELVLEASSRYVQVWTQLRKLQFLPKIGKFVQLM